MKKEETPEEMPVATKVYHVGSGIAGLPVVRRSGEAGKQFFNHVERILVSYVRSEALSVILQIPKEVTAGLQAIFIDSGAFSVWTRGEVITRSEYFDFLDALYADFEDYPFEIHCVNLDLIPGEKGRDPTLHEVENSAAESHAIYHWFKQAFPEILPVFHWGEDFYWLDLYLDEADYICISPGPKRPVQVKKRWLDRVFEHLDQRGAKKKKFHGLGITTPFLVERYPWHSVDSTRAFLAGGMATIYLPGNIEAKDPSGYDYRTLVEISVANKEVASAGIFGSSKQRKQGRLHLSQLSTRYRDGVKRYLLTLFGYTLEDMDLYYNRWEINCWAMNRLGESRSRRKNRRRFSAGLF